MNDGYHEFENVELLSGVVLPRVRLAFATCGKLNAERSNAVLFPTWFSSTHHKNAWLIGLNKPLNPEHYFIICVDLIGNGLSTSPSNTDPPFDGPRFPEVHILDNVRLQRRLLIERFKIESLQLVIGRSMGAQTAFQWAVSFPSQVRRMFALCGSSRTTPHNYAFIDSLEAALKADCRWNGGDYISPPIDGLRAIGKAYAAWAMSPEFYRLNLHLRNAATIDDYLERQWANNFTHCDANNLLAMMRTWKTADISTDPSFQGDWQAALKAITCQAIVMPSRTDQYFPPEDSAAAAMFMPNAELRVLDSAWGHRAGSPGSDPTDIATVEAAIADLLKR